MVIGAQDISHGRPDFAARNIEQGQIGCRLAIDREYLVARCDAGLFRW
jgi:hypothetical protein